MKFVDEIIVAQWNVNCLEIKRKKRNLTEEESKELMKLKKEIKRKRFITVIVVSTVASLLTSLVINYLFK